MNRFKNCQRVDIFKVMGLDVITHGEKMGEKIIEAALEFCLLSRGLEEQAKDTERRIVKFQAGQVKQYFKKKGVINYVKCC